MSLPSVSVPTCYPAIMSWEGVGGGEGGGRVIKSDVEEDYIIIIIISLYLQSSHDRTRHETEN